MAVSDEQRRRNVEATRRCRANRSPERRQEVREYQTKYRLAHKAYYAKYERDYRAADPLRRIFKFSRLSAARRGLEHTITKEDLLPLPEFCPALGIRLNYTPRGRSFDDSPSVDRIDNSKGYVPGNVVIVSWRANQIKRNATVAELCLIAAYYSARTQDVS